MLYRRGDSSYAPRVTNDSPKLTVTNHDRDRSGHTYVYPVISRRSGGVSVGINLNPNRACNFRCIYCQVPNLRRGVAPEIDLSQLDQELDSFIEELLEGDYMEQNVPEGSRRLMDVALSGDGEPTTCKRFDRVIETIASVLVRHKLVGTIKVVLITNGTMIHRPEVQRGLAAMANIGGDVWFKIDGGSETRRRTVNDFSLGDSTLLRNLATAAGLCPTRIQTCVFSLDGQAPSLSDCDDYLALLTRALAAGVSLQGVSLYGIARSSQQPEAARLGRLRRAWLESFGARIEALGISATVHE